MWSCSMHVAELSPPPDAHTRWNEVGPAHHKQRQNDGRQIKCTPRRRVRAWAGTRACAPRLQFLGAKTIETNEKMPVDGIG
jgi:hypothetical protein